MSVQTQKRDYWKKWNNWSVFRPANRREWNWWKIMLRSHLLSYITYLLTYLLFYLLTYLSTYLLTYLLTCLLTYLLITTIRTLTTSYDKMEQRSNDRLPGETSKVKLLLGPSGMSSIARWRLATLGLLPNGSELCIESMLAIDVIPFECNVLELFMSPRYPCEWITWMTRITVKTTEWH